MDENDAKKIAENTAYEDVVEAAELRDVRLIESQFKMLSEILIPDQSTWRYGYSCEVTDSAYDDDGGFISAFVHASAFCRSGRKNILSVKAKYVLIYDVSGKTDTSTADRFSRAIGAFSVYPYFRSLFADLTSQGGARVPPLPIMRGARRSLMAWAGKAAPE